MLEQRKGARLQATPRPKTPNAKEVFQNDSKP
jgi:hypothetical protein